MILRQGSFGLSPKPDFLSPSPDFLTCKRTPLLRRAMSMQQASPPSSSSSTPKPERAQSQPESHRDGPEIRIEFDDQDPETGGFTAILWERTWSGGGMGKKHGLKWDIVLVVRQTPYFFLIEVMWNVETIYPTLDVQTFVHRETANVISFSAYQPATCPKYNQHWKLMYHSNSHGSPPFFKSFLRWCFEAVCRQTVMWCSL